MTFNILLVALGFTLGIDVGMLIGVYWVSQAKALHQAQLDAVSKELDKLLRSVEVPDGAVKSPIQLTKLK